MKQPNDIGNNKDLALYRVDIAKDDLRSAKIYWMQTSIEELIKMRQKI